MKRLVMAVAAGAAVIAFSGLANAAPEDTRVALHLNPLTKKNICTAPTGLAAPADSVQKLPCSSFITAGAAATQYHCYIILANGDVGPGISAFTWGMDWNPPAGGGAGLYVDGWVLCADLAFTSTDPAFPTAKGCYATASWDVTGNCQRTELNGEGVHSVAGALYMYAYGPSDFNITPKFLTNPDQAILEVAACDFSVTNLPHTSIGIVSFGGTGNGCNPCQAVDVACVPIATSETTWGKIKKRFSEGE